jgi:hypothetical protein
VPELDAKEVWSCGTAYQLDSRYNKSLAEVLADNENLSHAAAMLLAVLYTWAVLRQCWESSYSRAPAAVSIIALHTC